MLDHRSFSRFLAGALVVGLASCAAPPRPAATPPAAEPTRPAPAGPATIFEVVASDVTVRVYRDGPLAELGHNHVIASTGLTGHIELRQPLGASTLALELPLASLTVDEPVRRAAAGVEFPDNVTQTDREGTRRNMMGASLLDAGQFPALALTSLSIDGQSSEFRVTTRVSLAGQVRDIVVPVTLGLEGDTLTAHGGFTVTHAQLGLSPFSAAMGALRVRDDMQVSYRLVAREVGGAT